VKIPRTPEQSRQYYENQKNSIVTPAERLRAYRAKNPGIATEYQKAYNSRLINDLYTAYGDTCACCGEFERDFLEIHHIGGTGKDNREEIGTGLPNLARHLRDAGYPPIVTILCANCHRSVTRHGYCLHNPEKLW
jgi:hypothetical protein